MAEQNVQSEQDSKPSRRVMRVLILDDDPSCRILLKSSLKKSLKDKRDVEITEKDTLKQTIETLQQSKYDILLVDLNLPDCQGLDTLDVLHDQFPDVPIVVITGETDETVGLQAMSHGAQEYLVKGEYTPRSLEKAIYFAFERKRLQADKDYAYQKLQNAHRQIQLAQAQIVQNEKMASIGQLAAGIAHEMNTPVGFVACNFETLNKYMQKISVLLRQYECLTDLMKEIQDVPVLEQLVQIKKLRTELKVDFILEDLKSLFEESQEGFARITTIIQNLKDFSRIDQVGEVTEYDINQGIRSTMSICQNEIKYTCDITTDFGLIPQIYCNPGQINQVFLNILVNAAQAISSQERPTKGNIIIKTFNDTEWVYCRIQDDGPGISPENMKRVFDPFFTTKPVGKGTGLGLNVSYDIVVNKHNGQISADSVYGQGTTFTIKLPIHSACVNTEKYILLPAAIER